jgi:hypothetical protein
MGNKKPKKTNTNTKPVNQQVDPEFVEAVKDLEAIAAGAVEELDFEDDDIAEVEDIEDVKKDVKELMEMIPKWTQHPSGEMVGYGYTFISMDEEEVDRIQQIKDIIEAHVEQDGVIVVMDLRKVDDMCVLGDIIELDVNEQMRSMEAFIACIDEDGTFYPDALKIALHYIYKSVKGKKIDTIMLTTECYNVVKNLNEFKNVHLPLTEVVLQYNNDLSTNLIIEVVPEEKKETGHIPVPEKKEKKKDKKKKDKDKKKKDKKKKKK